jgi:heterodisulfide reductase subunit A
LERLGIRPQRLQLEWISAAEGQKFAKVMKELEEMRQKVTAEEVEGTIKILEKEEEKERAKKEKRLAALQPAEAV